MRQTASGTLPTFVTHEVMSKCIGRSVHLSLLNFRTCNRRATLDILTVHREHVTPASVLLAYIAQVCGALMSLTGRQGVKRSQVFVLSIEGCKIGDISAENALLFLFGPGRAWRQDDERERVNVHLVKPDAVSCPGNTNPYEEL